MQSITSKECATWLSQNQIDALDSRGFPEVVGDYEVFFAAPKATRAQQELARDLLVWLGNFDNALFWITCWTAYNPEEMAIISRLRRAHGEARDLINANGHIFRASEFDELVGWVFLTMSFAWDGYVFASPFAGKMFQTSHEEFIWITSSDQGSFEQAREFPRKFKLEIFRETNS